MFVNLLKSPDLLASCKKIQQTILLNF